LSPTKPHHAHSAVNNIRTKQDLAAFLHACAFSPLESTWLWAIQQNHFSSWPGLTASLVTKHLAKSLATSKGHLRMQQQNIKSTKITAVLPLAVSLDVSRLKSLKTLAPMPSSPRFCLQPTSASPTPTKPASFPSNPPVAINT
jgi:hypothetical protein